jgi:hypothetical protein
MQEAYTPGRNITDHLYEVCCDAIKGRPFGDIISLPQKDARFTYGAAKGDDGLIDLNYMSILVSIRSDEDGNAEVLNEYEVYDTNGGFVEYRRYMQPFLDFCGYLMEGSGYYKYNSLIVSAQEKVDDNGLVYWAADTGYIGCDSAEVVCRGGWMNDEKTDGEVRYFLEDDKGKIEPIPEVEYGI